MNKKIILVVCRGNITRSAFAEVVINRELKKSKLNKKFLAISRGTQGTSIDPIAVKFPNITFYKDEYRFSKPTLNKFKVNIINRISKPVDKKVAMQASLILAVDQINKDRLNILFPSFRNKIFKLSELVEKDEDFIDPERINGVEKHRQILCGIHDTIKEGFPKLLTLANNWEKN